uniref:G-protein coupled receptors family 1 profile domain-containing protein n=3 Tax=Magallana gigas TaxID=29159 RepID=A0A8W8KMH9_MAGGI|nr:cardioacceleratory peptide receptor [Crassostrea gigas]|eukprot:XP_011439299.1 PREDICTED: cardioacceleratory peptide receptor [Crassostrea gigas]
MEGVISYNETNSTLSNVTGNSSTNFDHYYFFKTEQRVFLCVLFLCIISGNTAVLVIIFLTRKLRSRMNIFMANLAIADLLVGLNVGIDLLEKFLVDWYGGDVLCKAVKFYSGVAVYGSTYALVAMSIDRFDSVARPLQTMAKGFRVRLLIGIQWGLAYLFSMPMFMYKEEEKHSKVQCHLSLPEPWMWRVYITLTSLAVMFVPTLIIAICYITIVTVVWRKSSFTVSSRRSKAEDSCMELSTVVTKDGFSEERTPLKPPQQKRVHWQKTSGSSSRGIIPKAKIKTVKMTFVIVLVFVFCWTPYWTFNLLAVYDRVPQSQSNIAISVFIQSLYPLNSAANPLIFFLFNSALYKRLCAKRSPTAPPTTSVSHL